MKLPLSHFLKLLIRAPALLISASLLVVILSFLIANSFQSSISGKTHYWIIITTVIGIGILFFLVLINLAISFRQFRRGQIGSRLSLRLIAMFILLNLLPLFMVYFFAVQFLNKGIDSWFDVRVEQAIDDAVLLGQTSLEALTQDMIREMRIHSKSIANTFAPSEISRMLNEIAEKSNYSRVSLLSNNGQIIASSFDNYGSLFDDTPNIIALSQVKLGQTFSTIESFGESSQQLKVITPVISNNFGIPPRALQAIKPLPLRYARLARTVESAKTQYDQMLFAREPLKLSLILTLTLISLGSLLVSSLASFYVSRRIAKPLSVLAHGTKEVASGNLDTQLPVASKDEIGILVSSFNDMTQQLNHARNLTQKSQIETEEQRQYLETVLSNLSSGVISIDEKNCLESANATASAILNIDLNADLGMNMKSLSQKYENLDSFFNAIHRATQKNVSKWQDERTVLGLKGKQFLIIQGTKLPLQKECTVVVFDDITNLMHAQKDAAWGEVARRLAHEIKNPLTPIQLSAERIQNKFSDQLEGKNKISLQKSTRTIVQQVETLKKMVASFSDYAQAINTEKQAVDLHLLLSDIAELHKNTISDCELNTQFDTNLDTIPSDENVLRQIFNNLILNAVQSMATEKHKVLTITSSLETNKAEQRVIVSIADTGTGIQPDIRETLFEPYVSSKQQGSGLGLAIVKRLTEDLGGNVWVEENQPKGSRFTVSLLLENENSIRD